MDLGFKPRPQVPEAAFGKGQEKGFVWGCAAGQWFPHSHTHLWERGLTFSNDSSSGATRVQRGIHWFLSGERLPEEAWMGRKVPLGSTASESPPSLSFVGLEGVCGRR